MADIPEPIGRRPVLILTRTSAIPHLKNVSIATISRTIRHADTEVILTKRDGMTVRCAVSLDNIITIPQHILDLFVTRLLPARMDDVFEAIRIAYDMPY